MQTGTQPGGFKAGQRVFLKSLNKYGTVISPGTIHGSGGIAPQIHIDGALEPDPVAVAFDPVNVALAPNAPPAPTGGPPPDWRSLPNNGIGGRTPGKSDLTIAQSEAQLATLPNRGMPPAGNYKVYWREYGTTDAYIGSMTVGNDTTIDGSGNLNIPGAPHLPAGDQLLSTRYAGTDETASP